MMDCYTVSCFGHRRVLHPARVEAELEEAVRSLLLEKEYVTFLIGRNGDFDLLAASTIRRVRKAVREDNSELVLVLPYLTAEYRNNQEEFHRYYDRVKLSASAAGAHFKSAMQIRNREMVDRSDLVLCYIEHESGGAYQTVRYAIKSRIEVRYL